MTELKTYLSIVPLGGGGIELAASSWIEPGCWLRTWGVKAGGHTALLLARHDAELLRGALERWLADNPPKEEAE